MEVQGKDAELSLNFTQSVWDHLSNEHSKMIKELMSMDNVSLYISKEGIKLSEITVTDRIMLLGLFDKNGKFDQQFVITSYSIHYTKLYDTFLPGTPLVA